MPFSANGTWKPNKKQEPFLALPNEIFEGFYGGGAGSGKSEVLLVYGVVRGWINNPKFKQVFMRRTYAELKLEIVPRSREFYKPLGATFNRSDMVWTFKRPDQFGGTGMSNDGAIIKLGHCEYDDDVHNYDSMEINLFTPDEITSLTKFIYTYIALTRVRSSQPGVLPAIVRAAGMPGDIGHTWVKQRFVAPLPAGQIIKGKGGLLRVYIHATYKDNENVDPTYGQKLEGLDEAELKAKKYGDWNAYVGTVFNEFRDRHIEGEPESALHVVSPMDIPSWWPKIVVIDWGFRAWTWVGFGAISPSKRLYLYRELAWQKTRIAEWGAELKEYIDLEEPRLIKVCKSAGQDRGTDKTIQVQIEEILDRQVELTSNTPGSRIAGKMLLHEYLRWKPKFTPIKDIGVYDEEHARWVLRNRGMKEYESYIESFNPNKTEENLPKLQILAIDTDGTPCAPLLVEAIKAASYAKDKEGKPAEDVAEFEGDDAYDGIRYLCDAADGYFEDAAEEFKKVQEQAKILNALATSNDYTAFYRNSFSAESLNSTGPISMIRRRR